MYILVYIHRRYPYSYPPKLSNVYPCISSFIPVQYPGIISLMISNYDISDYIQIYPFVSNIDILIRYPWCYPIQLSWHILVILVLYPGKYPWWYPIMISWLHPSISMMFIQYRYPYKISLVLSFSILRYPCFILKRHRGRTFSQLLSSA